MSKRVNLTFSEEELCLLLSVAGGAPLATWIREVALLMASRLVDGSR